MFSEITTCRHHTVLCQGQTHASAAITILPQGGYDGEHAMQEGEQLALALWEALPGPIYDKLLAEMLERLADHHEGHGQENEARVFRAAQYAASGDLGRAFADINLAEELAAALARDDPANAPANSAGRCRMISGRAGPRPKL